MAESPVVLLRAHAKHAPWNARGLAAHAGSLVDAAGIRPTNASARVAPSARSIRFYVSAGLIDRPEGTGTAATYHYRHLLQLLAVKIRQREGQSLETIKTEISGMTGDMLERRIATSLEKVLLAKADQVAATQDDSTVVVWRRIPVAEGIEIHVREDSVGSSESSAIAMREAVRAAIGRG